MTANIIMKKDKVIKIQDLAEEVKKNPKIGECGAIFSFEGIVRGVEKGKITEKMNLTTPHKEVSEKELQGIIKDIKNKYNVIDIRVVHYIGEFQVGDSLFLVVVAGAHRGETREALNEVIERVKYEIDFKKEEFTDGGTNIIMSGG
jgi:molybdopterin synthase catalytic subunit